MSQSFVHQDIPTVHGPHATLVQLVYPVSGITVWPPALHAFPLHIRDGGGPGPWTLPPTWMIVFVKLSTFRSDTAVMMIHSP